MGDSYCIDSYHIDSYDMLCISHTMLHMYIILFVIVFQHIIFTWMFVLVKCNDYIKTMVNDVNNLSVAMVSQTHVPGWKQVNSYAYQLVLILVNSYSCQFVHSPTRTFNQLECLPARTQTISHPNQLVLKPTDTHSFSII